MRCALFGAPVSPRRPTPLPPNGRTRPRALRSASTSTQARSPSSHQATSRSTSLVCERRSRQPRCRPVASPPTTTRRATLRRRAFPWRRNPTEEGDRRRRAPRARHDRQPGARLDPGDRPRSRTVPVGTAAEPAKGPRPPPRASTSRWHWMRNSCARATAGTTPLRPTALCLAWNGIRPVPRRRSGNSMPHCLIEDVQFLSPTCRPRTGQGVGELLSRHQDLVHQRDLGGARGLDADVTLLADALGYDPRMGRRFLNAGLGFGGGSCPRTSARSWRGPASWAPEHALLLPREVDTMRHAGAAPTWSNWRPRHAAAPLRANIAILGAALEPDSDNVRDSPALNIAGVLRLRRSRGQRLRPEGDGQLEAPVPDLNYSTSVMEACGACRRGAGAAPDSASRRAGSRRPCQHGARQ